MAHTLVFLEHNNTEAVFGCTDCDRTVVLKIADGSTVTLAQGTLVDHGAQDLAAVYGGMNAGQRNRRATSAELRQLETAPGFAARRRP